MRKFDKNDLSDNPSYPRKAVARFGETIKDPAIRSEFIDLTAGLVMDIRSRFCSSKEIYETLKGGSNDVLEAAKPLYNGESDEDMDFVMSEDYEDPRQ